MRAAASILVAFALAAQAVPVAAASRGSLTLTTAAPQRVLISCDTRGRCVCDRRLIARKDCTPARLRRAMHARFVSDADVTSAVRGVFAQLAPNPDPGNLEPQPVTDLGLQPGPGGTVLRYPLANTVLPSGFSVLNVTLVDQGGRPVALGGSTGGTAASAQTFPVDASGRQVISPSTLPTPPALQQVAGTVTVANTPAPAPTPIAYPTDAAGRQVISPTTLPTPQTLPTDASGRQVISPTTLPTPIPFPTVQTIAAVPIGGPFLPIPVPTANGAALVSGLTGIELSVQPGASVTYGCFASAPTAPPAQTRTVANPASATIYVSDAVNTAAGVACYLTAATTSTGAAVTSANASSAGTPFYRSI